MSARNRFFILLGIIFVIAASYYFFSTDHSRDLVLIGTVDANQVIVSAQVRGRIQKLLVDEGTPVKAGDLIAVLDPSELQAQEAAATRDDHQPAAQSHRDAAYRRIDQGIDFERCRECAGQAVVGEGTTDSGEGPVGSHRERQPAHDCTGEGGYRVGPGARAGRDQLAGRAGDRAGAAGTGDGPRKPI